MADVQKRFTQASGVIWNLFPHEKYGLSFAAWLGLKREAVESAAPNLGRYTVTLDDTYRYWFVFEGGDPPVDWDQYVDVVDLFDIEDVVFSARDLQQLRYQLGMNGTAQAPVQPVPDPIVITPGTSNLKCVGWLLCLNSSLNPEPNVVVSFRMIRGPGASGFSYNTPVETVTSDSEGIARMESLRRGSTIEYWRSGSSQKSRKTAVIPDAPTFALPELL